MNNITPTKEKQLLIYMKYAEDCDYTFTLQHHASIVISRGMTLNKQSLNSMLTTLKNKGFVVNTQNRGEWVLTELGRAEAEYWIQHYYYDNKQQPIGDNQPTETANENVNDDEPDVDDEPNADDEFIAKCNDAVDYWLRKAVKYAELAAHLANRIEIRIY